MKKTVIVSTIALILIITFFLLGYADVFKLNRINLLFIIVSLFVITIMFVAMYLTILYKRKKNSE